MGFSVCLGNEWMSPQSVLHDDIVTLSIMWKRDILKKQRLACDNYPCSHQKKFYFFFNAPEYRKHLAIHTEGTFSSFEGYLLNFFKMILKLIIAVQVKYCFIKKNPNF